MDTTLDLDDFETLFRAAPVKKIKQKVKETKPTGAAKTCILEPNKAKSIAISLARFQLSPVEIGQAISEMNETVLTVDRLEIILQNFPTETELQTVQTLPYENLSAESQLIAEIGKVHDPPALIRLRGLLTRHHFGAIFGAIEAQVSLIHEASLAISQSESLTKLLGIILRIGNHINSSNPRLGAGQAKGFRLETLSQLKMWKSGDNSTNLLNYVVTYVLRKCPEVAHFTTELECVNAALRVDYNQVRAEVKELQTSIQEISQELTKLNGLSPTEGEETATQSPFQMLLSPFIDTAQPRVTALAERAATVEQEYQELMSSFGIDPVDPASFFQMFADFTRDFREAERNVSQTLIKKSQPNSAEKEKAQQKSSDALRIRTHSPTTSVRSPSANTLRSPSARSPSVRSPSMRSPNLPNSPSARSTHIPNLKGTTVKSPSKPCSNDENNCNMVNSTQSVNSSAKKMVDLQQDAMRVMQRVNASRVRPSR